MVFTKFDLLVRKLEKLADDYVDEEELERLVLMRAEEIFNETCVQKLKSITRQRTNPISYVKVSSTCSAKVAIIILLTSITEKPQYQDTLNHLVDETQRCLDNHISILWALAQRTSVDAKVNACIEYVANFIRTFSRLYFSTEWVVEVCLRVSMVDLLALNVSWAEYWRGLASSIHFPGKTLEQCLNRIHDDMIDIWNFNDPMNVHILFHFLNAGI